MLRQLQKISSRDRLLLVLLVVMSSVLAIVARPVFHLGLTAWLDRDERVPVPPGSIDDASHLNRARMDVVQVTGDLGATEAQLRAVWDYSRCSAPGGAK